MSGNKYSHPFNPDKLEVRFWEKVAWDKAKDNAGCWLWTGAKSPPGYGQVTRQINGKATKVPAHRQAFIYLRGPIPEGKVLDHLCMTKLCVNPDHLDPVTTEINMVRGVLAKNDIAVYIMPNFNTPNFMGWVRLNTLATLAGAVTGLAALVIAVIALTS
ncbi:hypothetical protein LCGC14_1741880 [marine sediment metagenome]|uniref:HNH nuclease domain-containing protein n=1 Tax=marine sediment metagenome TaxID=412755 RepID=A0A0F9HU21_9ZZZZ